MLSVSNVDAQLTNSAASVLAAGISRQLLLLKATVCNTDVAARTVNIWRVPSAGSPGGTNLLVDALSVPAGQTLPLPLSGQTLVNGQSLYADASVSAAVNLSLSYATIS